MIIAKEISQGYWEIKCTSGKEWDILRAEINRICVVYNSLPVFVDDSVVPIVESTDQEA